MYSVQIEKGSFEGLDDEETLIAWHDEVLAKMVSLGFPPELWPADKEVAMRLVTSAKLSGRIPRTVPLDIPMLRSKYTGESMPPSVIELFDKTFPHMQNAIFVFTDGDPWWPGPNAFVAHDADSHMQYCFYEVSFRNGVLVEWHVPKVRDNKQAMRTAKSARYDKWLRDCAEYRAHLEDLEREYADAKAAADRVRERIKKARAAGAPKWIP